MFFNGDLQSGIALALRESKYVVCFVRDGSEQSVLWEDTFLKDEQIIAALDMRAVTLRIDTGSQEAGYLSAYYPVPVVPALIIIQNGQLCLDVRYGEVKDSFKTAILKTLVDTSAYDAPISLSTLASVGAESSATSTGSNQPNVQPSTPREDAASTPQFSNQPTVPSETAAASESAPAVDRAPGSTTHPSSSSSNARISQTVQNLLAERRCRLEIDKKEKEAAEKAERKAKADAREASMLADPNSAKAKQGTYAQQQRKRQQEAKQERERILKQIEHDKIERKEKEEQRKALAKAEAEGRDEDRGLIDQQLANAMSRGSRPASARECAIQVRMFDGSTIRNRFPSDQTLRTDVRPWVDKERLDGDFPYTFKQILSPLPNRTLCISEEEETLHSLNLTPSATLVMVPVQGYTAAYSENQSLVSRGATAGYNVVSAGAGFVSEALGNFLGFGQVTTPVQESATQESTPQPTPDTDTRKAASGIKIRTLRDQRNGQEDHQLYNGNQLNFEPRRDDDDKED